MVAGRADLGPRSLGELAQLLGFPRLGLQVVAQPPGGGDLVLPADVEAEGVLAEQLLLGLALVRARHVSGRHGDQVGGRPDLVHGGGDPRGAEQVDLDGLGQRGVEGDRGGRVDDDARLGEGGAAFVVESEPLLPHVSGDGADPLGDLVVEAVAQLVAQAVEAVVLDDLAGQPGRCVGPAAGPHQEGDLRPRDAAQDPLDQGRAQEAGGTGDEEALPTEIPLNGHRECLPLPTDVVYHMVSDQLSDQ